jgi:hypothetical protein
MLSSPFAYVRKQAQDIQLLYLQLEEEKLLALIEEKLRTGQIPWETLFESQEGPVFLETRPLKLPAGQKSFEAKLFLAQGSFQEKEDKTVFGSVKAVVKIYEKSHQKPTKKPVSVTLFVLKKQAVPIHGAVSL